MNKEPTIKDVLDSMTQKQLTLLYSLLNSILDGTYLLDIYVEYEMTQHRYTELMKDVTKYLMKMARKERKKIIAEERKDKIKQTKNGN